MSTPKESTATTDQLAEEYATLLEEWSNLEDAHDFITLLGRHKMERIQAMEAASGRFTCKVEDGAAKKILKSAAESGMQIMVFVGNPGAIQIHTGPAKNIVATGEWINVLDPDFNLHLKEPGITSSWVVEKPTRDGAVTSLEIYDSEGENIAQFFDARKPGAPERDDWRVLLADL